MILSIMDIWHWDKVPMNNLMDEIWFMPNGNPPHKDQSSIKMDAAIRSHMVELAIADKEAFRLEKYEILKEGVCCSYETMAHFVKQYPENEFYFIMGGDSLDYLETWKHPEIITALAIILVVPRYPFEPEVLNAKIDRLKELFACDIRLIPCPEYPISSTAIRQSLAEGKPLEKDFPIGVLAYIRDKKLYTV